VDGFPSILYINNEFYGIGCLNIGKKRQNYNLDSQNQSNIQMAADGHCSFTTYNESTWEIRNPKTPDEEFINRIAVWFESNKLTGEAFKSQFPTNHNLSNAIDYYIFIELLKADDCVDKNFLLTSWDGVQYAFMPYDLDTTFGLWWNGSQLVSADGSVLDSTNNLTSSSVTFWKKFKSVYESEIKERYAMLRQNVISVGNISNMLHDFMAVFGLENFEKEAERWPTIPSNTSVQTSLSQIMKWVSDRLTHLDTMFNV
jgi:hypothetical protein